METPDEAINQLRVKVATTHPHLCPELDRLCREANIGQHFKVAALTTADRWFNAS